MKLLIYTLIFNYDLQMTGVMIGAKENDERAELSVTQNSIPG